MEGQARARAEEEREERERRASLERLVGEQEAEMARLREKGVEAASRAAKQEQIAEMLGR